ncbi:unnamed protein product [Prunus armeniaca]
MIIVSWNVKGDGKESCARTIKDLKKAYAIDNLAILEPRIGGTRALQIAKSLGFSGAKFTWCNKRNAEGIVWKRLDRVLSNIAGRFLFPKAHLSHLPRSNNGNAVLKSAGLVSHLVSWNRKSCSSYRSLEILVEDCFLTATLPENINKTLIALVPKVERPISMTQLRPISLYNTLYKVIYKILVAQLRPCMTSLVSPNQVSFVPGRQIVDNIVVA